VQGQHTFPLLSDGLPIGRDDELVEADVTIAHQTRRFIPGQILTAVGNVEHCPIRVELGTVGKARQMGEQHRLAAFALGELLLCLLAL
jgi:hypothetical protein